MLPTCFWTYKQCEDVFGIIAHYGCRAIWLLEQSGKCVACKEMFDFTCYKQSRNSNMGKQTVNHLFQLASTKANKILN